MNAILPDAGGFLDHWVDHHSVTEEDWTEARFGDLQRLEGIRKAYWYAGNGLAENLFVNRNKRKTRFNSIDVMMFLHGMWQYIQYSSIAQAPAVDMRKDSSRM